MPIAGPLDFLPLWGFFAGTIALILLSVEAGYQLGQYRRRRCEEEKDAPVGAIVAATLGLLGFILAFTFGMASTRFDARRQVVVDEANAVRTTYLRAGLLPDGRGAKVRSLLRDYVDVRLEAAQSGDIEQALQRSLELHRELWKEAEAAGQKHPQSIVVGLFIQALNNTIDVHALRVKAAIRSRIPAVIWAILFLVAIFTMAGVGCAGGLMSASRYRAIVVL